MESIQPSQQYIARRFAGDLRSVVGEAVAEQQPYARSTEAFIDCLEKLDILPGFVEGRQRHSMLEWAQTLDNFSMFLRGGVEYWSKHRAGQPSEMDGPTSLMHFTQLLKGGIPAIGKAMEKYPFWPEASEPAKNEYRFRTMCHLPVLLLSSAGYSVRAALHHQLEDNERTDRALGALVQAHCEAIRMGQPFPRVTVHSELAVFFTRAMSGVREAYHGVPKQSLARVFARIYPVLAETEATTRQHSFYHDGRSSHIWEQLAALSPELGYSTQEVWEAYQTKRYAQEIMDTRELSKKQGEKFAKDKRKAVHTVMMTRLARRVVDKIAAGDISWPDILAVDKLCVEAPGPLARRAVVSSGGPRSKWRPVTPSPENSETDTPPLAHPGRVALLHTLASQWGGAQVFEPTERPADLGAEYYVAVFPEVQANGKILVHAIADHPQEGDHAAYGWRGENGQTASGHDERTWEEVFGVGARLQALGLGAVRFLHVGDYETRIEEFLTEPPSKLVRRNMRKNRRKTAQ